jgi:acetylornithine deacetylase/succinyl-diaminopimelate desuccinylase-like protein
MNDVFSWLESNQTKLLDQLAELVAIPCVSPGGGCQAELSQAAAWVAEALRQAGVPTVKVFPGKDRTQGAHTDADVVYAEWIVDPSQPTVLFYSHYDVQPVDADRWVNKKPFQLRIEAGRAIGRGAQDDKGGFVAQLAVMEAYHALGRKPPVNVKFILEGLEEVGSPFLPDFMEQQRELLAADAMVITDTENVDFGQPALTYSLRGCLTLFVTVRSAKYPSHSGMAGGGLADSAAALVLLLSRLFPGGSVNALPGLYDDVRKLSSDETAMLASLDPSQETLRNRFGVLDGVQLASAPGEFTINTTRKPTITIIQLKAGSMSAPSNQVLSEAQAVVSVRLVPDQDPDRVTDYIRSVLTKDVPWNVEVEVEPREAGVRAWMTEPTADIFSTAMQALETGYQAPAKFMGCGGTIGYVGPAAKTLGCEPLLFGISGGNAHSHEEFLDLADWLKLQRSIAAFLEGLRK